LNASAEKIREDFPGGFSFFGGDFLGGEKHIVVNIQRRSHASDDNASDEKDKMELS
jgi:hypothetical protein